jgi:hypothetical protein
MIYYKDKNQQVDSDHQFTCVVGGFEDDDDELSFPIATQ